MAKESILNEPKLIDSKRKEGNQKDQKEKGTDVNEHEKDIKNRPNFRNVH